MSKTERTDTREANTMIKYTNDYKAALTFREAGKASYYRLRVTNTKSGKVLHYTSKSRSYLVRMAARYGVKL